MIIFWSRVNSSVAHVPDWVGLYHVLHAQAIVQVGLRDEVTVAWHLLDQLLGFGWLNDAFDVWTN